MRHCCLCVAPATVSIQPESSVYTIGSMTIINCRADGLPTPNVTFAGVQCPSPTSVSGLSIVLLFKLIIALFSLQLLKVSLCRAAVLMTPHSLLVMYPV